MIILIIIGLLIPFLVNTAPSMEYEDPPVKTNYTIAFTLSALFFLAISFMGTQIASEDGHKYPVSCRLDIDSFSLSQTEDYDISFVRNDTGRIQKTSFNFGAIRETEGQEYITWVEYPIQPGLGKWIYRFNVDANCDNPRFTHSSRAVIYRNK